MIRRIAEIAEYLRGTGVARRILVVFLDIGSVYHQYPALSPEYHKE